MLHTQNLHPGLTKNSREGGTPDPANLDHLFHFCYIACKVGVEATALSTFVRGLSMKLSKILGESHAEDTLKSAFSEAIKKVPDFCDELEGGNRSQHKHQNPLMISLKRFLGGVTTLCHIPHNLQLLNFCVDHADNKTALSILANMYKVDLSYSSRSVDRNSLINLHKFLKKGVGT